MVNVCQMQNNAIHDSDTGGCHIKIGHCSVSSGKEGPALDGMAIGPTYRLPDPCLSLSSQPLDPARGYMHCLLRLTISKPPRLIIFYN